MNPVAPESRSGYKNASYTLQTINDGVQLTAGTVADDEVEKDREMEVDEKHEEPRRKQGDETEQGEWTGDVRSRTKLRARGSSAPEPTQKAGLPVVWINTEH